MPDKCVGKNVDLTQPFMVGDWLVEPAIERISKGDFEEKVEPRVMDLLVCLSSQAGEVIARQELESKVWAGMVVGYDALSSAMIKLRKAFHEDSKHPLIIQTVSKRGYRLIAEVKPVSSTTETVDTSAFKFIEKVNNKSLRVGLLALFVMVLMGLIYNASRLDSQSPLASSGNSKIPAIFVLPFVNMSDDPKQVYFSDGITEDIITDLSRISNLLVMARNTSFRYKGQTVKPIDIGKELNVQYLLEGSVRKAGEKLRLNVQLIDTQNGFHVWSNRYDRKLTEVFVVQDELTRNIVNALAIQLTEQEETSLARVSTNNFQAYEHFLQGQKLARERSRVGYSQAEVEFKRAINLDPTYARSYGSLAVVTIRKFTNGWTDSPAESRDRALDMAIKAVNVDNTLPQAYWALGFVHLYRNEFKQAAIAVKKAINIAPSYADGYGLLALINNRLGNADEAIHLINKAMKLNPHYTWDYPYNLGRAYYVKGDYERAIKELLIALERNENAIPARLFLVACYSALNMNDDAEWEVEQVLNVNPLITVSHVINSYSIANKKNMQMYILHLRKAGMPEK